MDTRKYRQALGYTTVKEITTHVLFQVEKRQKIALRQQLQQMIHLTGVAAKALAILVGEDELKPQALERLRLHVSEILNTRADAVAFLRKDLKAQAFADLVESVALFDREIGEKNGDYQNPSGLRLAEEVYSPETNKGK